MVKRRARIAGGLVHPKPRDSSELCTVRRPGGAPAGLTLASPHAATPAKVAGGRAMRG